MKNALIFIDRNQVKVVFGTVLKVIKVEELNFTHNVNFFEQLFREANVFAVQEISKISKEQLLQMVPSVPTRSQEERKVEASIERPVGPVPVPQRQEQENLEDSQHDFWVKSDAQTAIIIDDLFTGREIVDGMPECLSIPHGRAVNLANLKPENVKASRILARLMQNQIIERCSRREAMEMEQRYQERLNASRNAKSVFDSTVSVDVIGGRAEKFSYSEILGDGPRRYSDITEVDIMGGGGGSNLAHEGGRSMEQLMATINAAEEISAAGTDGQSNIAPRPRVPVSRERVNPIRKI